MNNKLPLDRDLLDLYSDYLICSFDKATATDLSVMVEGSVSHDQITRFLSKREYSTNDLYQIIKVDLKRISDDKGCISLDDTLEKKTYTDENDLMCWHFDHCEGRFIKGSNILSMIYTNHDIKICFDYSLVEKPLQEDGKRKSKTTKHQKAREMIGRLKQRNIPYKYLLMDVWFCTVETIKYIYKQGKDFITPVRSNRVVFYEGNRYNVNQMTLGSSPVRVHLKGLDQEMLLQKKTFVNKDGSTGELYLVSSDLTLTDLWNIYQKRWCIEEYHKSIKSNTLLTKSPTKTIKTQKNHIFCSIVAYNKLEILKIREKLNHFQIKKKLYFQALKASYEELKIINKSYSFLTI
jgi:hypothetical protein